MQRHFARKGDRTTTNGAILEGDDGFIQDGLPVAFHGAKVYCPACNSTGVILTVPPYHPFTTNGKQIALEGDLCVCRCSSPPKLLASQSSARMTFDGYDGVTSAPTGTRTVELLGVAIAELASVELASVVKTSADDDYERMKQMAYGDPRFWTAQAGPPAPGTASIADRTQLVSIDLPGLGNSYLDQSFAPRVEQFIADVAARGVSLHFNSAFRTPARQAALHNDPTAITPANISLHSCGFAVDVNYAVLPQTQQQIIREAANTAGLSWGGDFRTPDPPHFCMEPPIDRTTAVENATRQYNEMTGQ